MQTMDSVIDLLDKKREEVEFALQEHVERALQGPHAEAMELASEILLAGGKRWRPILVLLAYDLAGGKNQSEVMPLAIAFELIHTATLIHDDVYDESIQRRNVSTIHSSHGLAPAIIAGDYLFVEGFGLGGMYDEAIVRIMADCCANIAAGELKQLRHINDLGTTPDDYYSIIRGKTAGPFEAGCRGAAIIAGSPEMADDLARFGAELGLAFQLVDDLLDIEGDERMGKPRCTDVVEGKMTLPLIHSLTLSHGDSRRRLAEVLIDYEEADYDELTLLLNRSDSLHYARILTNNHLSRALDILLEFEESATRDALEFLTRMVMDRDA